MRKLILLAAFIISSMMIQAQSDSLIHAYKQVCKTLKDYKFTSQDVSDQRDGKTISITLKVQNGEFVFSVNDDFRPFNDPFFGVRHGVKTLKAPYRGMTFENDWWGERMYLRSKEGIELTYKGKKELIESYTIEGEKLTMQKLLKELQQLQTIVINEDFKGFLGGNSSSSKKNTPKAAAPQQNKQQKASQPQQRQRKQLTSGN